MKQLKIRRTHSLLPQSFWTPIGELYIQHSDLILQHIGAVFYGIVDEINPCAMEIKTGNQVGYHTNDKGWVSGFEIDLEGGVRLFVGRSIGWDIRNVAKGTMLKITVKKIENKHGQFHHANFEVIEKEVLCLQRN